jgi:hypothetical protein
VFDGAQGENVLNVGRSPVLVTSTLPFNGAFSHLSLQCEDFGNPCVMRPSLIIGTVARYLAPLERAILRDLGYTVTTTRDECWSAGITDVGETLIDTSGASASSGVSCSTATFGNDVWYQFTAPMCGTVTLSQCASSTTNIAIGVYTKCDAASFSSPRTCGNNRVTLAMSQGESVVVRVGTSSPGQACMAISIDGTSCSTCSNGPNLLPPQVSTGDTSFPNSVAINRLQPCNYPFTLNTVLVTWARTTSTSDTVSVYVWTSTDLSRQSPLSLTSTLQRVITTRYAHSLIH